MPQPNRKLRRTYAGKQYYFIWILIALVGTALALSAEQYSAVVFINVFSLAGLYKTSRQDRNEYKIIKNGIITTGAIESILSPWARDGSSMLSVLYEAEFGDKKIEIVGVYAETIPRVWWYVNVEDEVTVVNDPERPSNMIILNFARWAIVEESGKLYQPSGKSPFLYDFIVLNVFLMIVFIVFLWWHGEF